MVSKCEDGPIFAHIILEVSFKHSKGYAFSPNNHSERVIFRTYSEVSPIQFIIVTCQLCLMAYRSSPKSMNVILL